MIKSKLSSRFSYHINSDFRVLMSISKCIVRLKDSHDTEHSVVVYAESLYEAVVRGLNRLGSVGWESDTKRNNQASPVTAFIRWDERAGLQRDAISSR